MDFEPFETECEIEVDVDTELDTTFSHIKIKENIVTIHMKIKDYLYENSETDLLAYWTFYDTAEYIYDSSFLSSLDTSIF